MFKIQSDVPLPTRMRTGLGFEILKTALRCKPTQSFLVPMNRFGKLKYPLGSIPYKKAKRLGIKLLVRKERNGFRIWRGPSK